MSGEVLNPGEELIFKCPVLIGDDEVPCDKVTRLNNFKIVGHLTKWSRPAGLDYNVSFVVKNPV